MESFLKTVKFGEENKNTSQSTGIFGKAVFVKINEPAKRDNKKAAESV